MESYGLKDLTYSPSDFALLMEKYKEINISEGYNERDFYGRELYNDIDVLTLIEEFFDHGLNATTICQEDKNAFNLFLDSIYEGHRYALEGGGKEVKMILKLMFQHGGEEYLPVIIEDLRKVIYLEVNSDMIWEDFIFTYGLYSRGYVFGFILKELKIKPISFFREKEEWEMIEAKSFDDHEDSIPTRQKVLEIFKSLVEEYWESDEKEESSDNESD